MKTNQKMWTRMLSMVLTVCMLLGLVAVPVAFAEEVQTEETTALSTPIYTNAMDVASEGSPWYPTDWARSAKAQFARGGAIIVGEQEGDRTYYQMKRNGKESNAITWATSNPITDYSAAVLKYEVMIDNGDMTGWTVYLPSFAQSDKGRAIDIKVSDYVLGGTDMVLTPGKWHTIELSLTANAWKLYMDGEFAKEGTVAEAYVISCLTMGISNAGGAENAEEGLSAGANVAFNIDSMEIYACAAATEIAFAESAYAVAMGQTVATAWNVNPANGYIPGITYTSDNELVATVDASGVVTGVSAGTATITAIPAGASGMSAFTATVTVTDPSGLSDTNKAILSTPVYTNPMDEIASNKLYPVDWAKSSKAQNASASSIIPATAENIRQYYQMKRKGTDGNAISWATINPIADYSAAVLKYDVMIDNAQELAGWEVHLPAFSNDVRTRAVPVAVADYKIGKSDVVMTPGQWYTFEIVLNGTAWTLFVDGEKVWEDVVPEAQATITCLNMGIANKGGNPAEGENAGANVAFNIDNMAIYGYTAAASLAFEQESYTVAAGEKIAPKLTLAPAGAYLSAVTYTSSDDTIATVGVTGVVTGVANGTVTITATPAPSSGLAPVTTTVTVGETAPAGPETAADLVFLQAPSLSFQDYIGMQLLANGSLADTYDELYVEAIQIDPVKGAVTTKLTGMPYYGVYLLFDQQILSWSMAEEVTLTMYGVKDGKTYVGQSYTASVESLALSML
ncbi:MAG: Ig-like domain-containing protein, partial [Ruminococcaceae bacterium]|nr:Ig-like domain-containing protein [Oscillospiraceae bacterium]